MDFCYHCMTEINNEHIHKCPNCGESLKLEDKSSKYLKPGTILNKHFIVGCHIGEGGFGNTYIGWNDVLRRKVTIKEFFPRNCATRKSDGRTVMVTDESMRKRFQYGLKQFLDEARSVAALQDIKGVVAISNFFEENSTGYIVMEYLEGMDVKTILEKSGEKKDYEWCRRVILTVLHTLRQIHKRGVLHRDIAPDNIFVTKEGVIKLIDFGTAKHLTGVTAPGEMIFLKPGYSAIEQYNNQTIQGAYTDIYAVAAMFYRMLTGQKPIPANMRLKDDTLITPSEMGIELPESAEMAIMVCLNVKPEYRLQSADEFMEALNGRDFVPVYEPEWILPEIKEKPNFGRLPIATKISIGFMLLCIFMGSFGVGIYFVKKQVTTKEDLESVQSVVLSDYSGQQVKDIIRELKKGLGIKKVEYFYEFSDLKQGTIISQTPQPGEIDSDTTVTLYVSGADKKYTLSDYSGKDESEIWNWFGTNGFEVYEQEYPGAERINALFGYDSLTLRHKGRVELKCEYSDTVKCNLCIRQSVEGGSVCEEGDNLVFYISKGKVSDYEIPMPSVIGEDMSDAVEKLKTELLLDDDSMEIICENKEGVNEKEGIVSDCNFSEDSVFNSIEKKIYNYKGKKRENTVDSIILIIEKDKKIKHQKPIGDQ